MISKKNNVFCLISDFQHSVWSENFIFLLSTKWKKTLKKWVQVFSNKIVFFSSILQACVLEKMLGKKI
jgi:hypothetical protein